MSFEDETGVSNAIITPLIFEEYRLVINEKPFLVIEGVVQNIDRVIHVKAQRITALRQPDSALPASHDFH